MPLGPLLPLDEPLERSPVYALEEETYEPPAPCAAGGGCGQPLPGSSGSPGLRFAADVASLQPVAARLWIAEDVIACCRMRAMLRWTSSSSSDDTA